MNPQRSPEGRFLHRSLRITQWLIWLTLALLVSACSGNQALKPLADLQMPGISKIPGISDLQQHSNVDRIYHATTYQSHVDGNTTHVLFEVGQTAYDMRIDGSHLHPVTLPCSESVAVAPGGQWVACRTSTSVELHDVTNQRSDITINDIGQYPYSPSWAPDGHHLAVVTRLGGGCSVAIFGVSFSAGSTNVIALLSLPRFVTQESSGLGCSMESLTWSPDGTQLAFIDNDLWAVYNLPIASMHLLTRPINSPPLTLTITGDQMVRLGKCSSHSGLAWTASSKELTFVDLHGWNIEQVDVATHDMTTLIEQHTAGAFGLSWTPDGKQLLFVLGVVSDELTPPPSQMYVYTPSDA